VLNVYLNTDPTQTNSEAVKLWLKNELKNITKPEDVQAVEEYINLEYDWSAKGLAVFSNQKADFFRTYQFGLSLPNKVYLSKRPRVRPLVHLLDTFTGWSVVLVDKQQARLFSFHLGELAEMDSVEGDDVKQLKRGGGDAMPGRMAGGDISGRIENVIDRNIKEVIDSAITFFNQHRIRRIMIAGTDDNIARFKEELPKAWQSLVVGDFPMSMNASQNEVLEQARERALAAQNMISASLVEQAVTLAAKGSSGVIGLIDTLNAIHEGRVRTLLVSQDFEKEGYRCSGCGYLTTQELEKCPFCGGRFERIDAAVEMAVREALKKNAEVKIIEENEQLEEVGQIAAILRY